MELKNEIQRSIREEPEIMKQAQEEDLEISKVMCYVKLGKRPSLAKIRKLKSKIVHRNL